MRRLLLAALLAAAAPPAAAQHAHHHHSAPAEQSPRPTSLPAEVQRQLELVRAATARYRDFETARREGWTKFGGDSPLMGEHWSPPARFGWDQPPGGPLDLTRPSNLQYAWIKGRRELVGVSYIVRQHPGEPLPDGFAGEADIWHVHDAEAIVAAATKERPLVGCLIGGWLNDNWRKDGRTRLAMAHAWIWSESPAGVFADDNLALPYLRAGLPTAFAKGAGRDAAMGINLLTPSGCREAVDGDLWIAKAGAERSRLLRAACRVAAERVRAAHAARVSPDVLNREAEAAWRTVESERRRLLTPRQLQRIAVMTEHGPGHGDHHGR
jgi:hypothetical protein